MIDQCKSCYYLQPLVVDKVEVQACWYGRECRMPLYETADGGCSGYLDKDK